MAQKSDIQYIQFYTDGSAARQMEPKRNQRKKLAKRPRPHRQRRITIRLDPVAMCGIFVAAVMVILLVVGVAQLGAARQRKQEMEQYILRLQEQNEQLQAEYDAGYDPEEVEKAALSLGMVPADQVQRIPIQVTVPQAAAEPGFWERVCAFFAELFA